MLEEAQFMPHRRGKTPMYEGEGEQPSPKGTERKENGHRGVEELARARLAVLEYLKGALGLETTCRDP